MVRMYVELDELHGDERAADRNVTAEMLIGAVPVVVSAAACTPPPEEGGTTAPATPEAKPLPKEAVRWCPRNRPPACTRPLVHEPLVVPKGGGEPPPLLLLRGCVGTNTGGRP